MWADEQDQIVKSGRLSQELWLGAESKRKPFTCFQSGECFKDGNVLGRNRSNCRRAWKGRGASGEAGEENEGGVGSRGH